LAEKDFGKLEIRKAERRDAPVLLSLIKELAEYERMSDQVATTEEMLTDNLFGKTGNIAEAVIACYNGAPVGMAIYFFNFSTFVGRRGLYLEDLFVQPALRGKGIGKALLIYLAKTAVENNCGRFEWSVLDWNKPAIDFYKSLGAKPMDEWTIFRLSGDEIKHVAGL